MFCKYYYEGKFVAKRNISGFDKIRKYEIKAFALKDDNVYLVLINLKSNKMVLKKVGVETDMPYVKFLKKPDSLRRLLRKVVKLLSEDSFIELICFEDRKQLKDILNYTNEGYSENFERKYKGSIQDFLVYRNFYFKKR